MKSLSVIALAALSLAQVASAFTSLTTTQRNLAYQITSTWENENYDSSTQSWVLAFDYCENIGDGQGITIGFTGFTTNGGDALNMLNRYKAISSTNAFSRTGGLSTCLNSVQNTGNVGCFNCKDSACHSSTLCNAAKSAYANDRRNYILAQTQEDGQDNWVDSQALASKYNIALPLSQAFLYDSCVNHACDYDGNDVEGLIIRPALNGARSVGSSTSAQKAFFHALLTARKSYMCSSGCDCCDDSTWRIPGWNWLGQQGYWNLPNPMRIKTFQDGYDASVKTFKCNPNQYPGCSSGSSSTSSSTTSKTTATSTSNKKSTITSTTTSSSSPTSTSTGKTCNSSNNGATYCVDSGNSADYETCLNGAFIQQQCATGTVCKTSGSSIICDYP